MERENNRGSDWYQLHYLIILIMLAMIVVINFTLWNTRERIEALEKRLEKLEAPAKLDETVSEMRRLEKELEKRGR